MSFFGAAVRAALGGVSGGVVWRLGMYILGAVLVGVITAALIYHFDAVRDAHTEGARVERDTNSKAAAEAVQKVRLANEIRAKRLNSLITQQRNVADAEASEWAKYSANLEAQLEAQKDTKECWSEEITRGIYR